MIRGLISGSSAHSRSARTKAILQNTSKCLAFLHSTVLESFPEAILQELYGLSEQALTVDLTVPASGNRTVRYSKIRRVEPPKGITEVQVQFDFSTRIRLKADYHVFVPIAKPCRLRWRFIFGRFVYSFHPLKFTLP